MTAEEFNVILAARLDDTRRVLGAKAEEYATTADRLHNFKAAGGLGGGPGSVLWGYALKHLVVVKDLATGVRTGPPAVIREKVGDAVNYLILLEALLLEEARGQPADR